MEYTRGTTESRTRHWPVWGVLLLVMALGVPSTSALDFGRDPNPVFELGSYVAGQSPHHALGFSVARGELEAYRIVVTYADGFRFNGFDTLGPTGVQVGALTLDFDGDGAPDVTVPLRSLTPGSAYADVIPDGQFSPGLEPVLHHLEVATFVLRLPFGGDADADTIVVPFDARVTVVLEAGLVTNPRQPGTYVVGAELTSVDSDTGGADDGAGAAPRKLAFEVALEITAPAAVPFAEFCIDKADLGERRFTVHGRYVFGAGSDGASFPADAVSIAFAGFEQTLPGSAFAALGRGVLFHGRAPGITRLLLRADGHFQVDVAHVDPGVIDRTNVPFSLVIGDDRGEAALAFDRNGHLRAQGTVGCRP